MSDRQHRVGLVSPAVIRTAGLGPRVQVPGVSGGPEADHSSMCDQEGELAMFYATCLN